MFMDPIADLISKIKNANNAHLKKVVVNTSKMLTSILQILLDEGYIESFENIKTKKQNKMITIVRLKYQEKVSSISGIKQISKPGLRVYTQVDKIPHVLNGLGVAIVSTSQGVMTDKNARKNNLGGELIAYVW